MKSFSSYWRWKLPLSLLLLSGSQGICLNPPPALSAEEIMKKAVARAQCAAENGRRADYAYTKQVIVEDLDSQGRVTETKEKLFRFRSGLGSLEQVKINGQMVGGARLKKEEERIARQGQLVDAKTSKRDDHWEKYLTPELITKYQFTLREGQLINGRPAYLIAFRPRSGELPVRQMADHLLNHLAGRVWIDEQEFEIVRADISAQTKVTLGGVMDLLGSLSRFSYVLERIRLEDGTWFNRRAKGDFEGRKLLDNTHVKTRSETSDFHKTSAVSLNR
jgi:hypothetical protein